MRQFAPCEGRDGPVFNARRPGQTHPDRPLLLGLPGGLRQRCLAVDRPPAFEALLVEIRMMVAPLALPQICNPASRRNNRPSMGVEHGSHRVFHSCAVQTRRERSIRGKTCATRPRESYATERTVQLTY